MKRRIFSLWLLLCCTFIGHQALAQQTWTPQTLEDGASYYILNKATAKFLNGTLTLASGSPAVYTAKVTEDGKCSFANANGGYVNVTIEPNPAKNISAGGANPKSVSASANGSEVLFAAGGDENGYTFSTSATWTYRSGLTSRTASYTAFLSAVSNDEEGVVSISTTTSANEDNAIWILVSVDEYKSSPAARADALTRLSAAIAAADEAQKLEGPAAKKGDVGLAETAAKTVKRTAESSNSYIANSVSVDVINQSAANLEEKTSEYIAISDFYAASKASLEQLKDLGAAGKAAYTEGIAALNLASTISGMEKALTSARVAALAALAGTSLVGFDDNTNFTGLISNNSFDTGTMYGWNHLKVDLDASVVINMIKNKDLSAIGDAISLGDFSEWSYPIVNQAPVAMQNGHNRYYYRTNNNALLLPKGESVFQILLGLPKGSYRASANMNCEVPLNSNHISVILVPTNIIQDIIGNIDITDLGNSSNIINGILGSLGTIIKEGKIETGTLKTTDKNKFEEVSVDFEIEDGAIAILMLDAGVVQLAGDAPFKADNVRLTYLMSPKSAKKHLAEAIAVADVPEANIAEKANNEHPFTYNTKLVEQYKALVEEAQGVYDSEDTKTVAQFNAATKKLTDFEDTFFDKAFQGPTSSTALFNMTMTDSKATTSCNKAVTFMNEEDNYSMKFSHEAGKTNFHQVLSFEKVSKTINTYLISMKTLDGTKHYLCADGTALATTTNQASALKFTVVPSTKMETVVGIQNTETETPVGVIGANDVLTSSNAKNLYSALSVTPAAKHEVALNISSLGYGTFMLPYSASVPSGFTAYNATGVDADNVVTLEKADKFEACTPYIVYYNGGNKTTLSGIALATENLYTDELLTGAFTLTDVPAGEGNYLLQNQESKGLGFYRVADDGLKIGANRAYLTYSGTQSVKLFIPSENATAIETIDSEAGENVIYDLSGRRVNNAVKGVYIINGKKVIK